MAEQEHALTGNRVCLANFECCVLIRREERVGWCAEQEGQNVGKKYWV